MIVRFKKLNDSAVIPSYAKPGDAGMDLTATGSKQTESFIEYDTGLAVEIPQGYVGFIFPRSSVSKTNLSLANSVGVIDSAYRGPIKIRFYTNHTQHNLYNIGDRVAQLIVMPFPYVEPVESTELSETERGEGGFGSTGA